MEPGQSTPTSFSTPRYRKRKRRPRFLIITLAVFCFGIAAVIIYLAPGMALLPRHSATALVIGNEFIGESLVRAESREIFIHVEALQTNLDPLLFWDDAEKTAVITTAERVIHMQTDALTAEVNLRSTELQFPLREEGGEYYLPLLFLSDFYGLEVQFHPESDTVVIDRAGEAASLAVVKVSTVRLRGGPGLRYPYLAQLKAGEELRLAEIEPGRWGQVRTSSGLIGYIPMNTLEIMGQFPLPEPPKSAEQTKPPRLPAAPLVMTWEFTYPNPNVEAIRAMPSLKVISPTWFHLKDNKGNLRNLADPAYVTWARERGYLIWALVSNDFKPEMTAQVLSSSALRRKVIDQLLIYAHLYELDGLNLDFENFHYTSGDLYTQFVRELAPLCREAGLVLSVDVTMISMEPYWSRGYDRGALAQTADYIVLMAYDEHWENGPVPGSVASLPWVEKGLQQVLKEVPPEKLILGVPFYTRIWQVKNTAGGDPQTSSRSYSMERVEEILAGKDIHMEWDSGARQNLARYTEGESTYKLWLEDTDSMRLRLELVNRYGLAGVAGWRRGLEKPEIWDLIGEVLSTYPAK